jgi:hypothetical protein
MFADPTDLTWAVRAVNPILTAPVVRESVLEYLTMLRNYRKSSLENLRDVSDYFALEAVAIWSK